MTQASESEFFGLRLLGTTRKGRWELLFLYSFAHGDWGGVACNQEIARVVGSLSALRAGRPGMATPGFPPPISNDGSMTGSLQLRDYPARLSACCAPNADVPANIENRI
jgi:hypothetical protein